MRPDNLGSAFVRIVQAVSSALRPSPGHQSIDTIKDQIDASLQWVSSQPNSTALWAKVQSTVENELTVFWTMGMLKGAAEEEAFFARCDESTMTKADIAAQRVVCLIGVAPVTPGQFTLLTVEQRCLPSAPPRSRAAGN